MATKKAVVKKTLYPVDLDKAVGDLEKSITAKQAEIMELEARRLDLLNQKPLREAEAFVGRTYVRRGTCRTNGEGEYARVLSASKTNPGKVILEVFQCIQGGVDAQFRRVELDWLEVEIHYEPLGKADFDRFRSEARKAIQ